MKNSEVYCQRFYRNFFSDSLKCWEIKIKESDLFICAEKNLKEISRKILKKYREEIEEYIKIHPEFEKTLLPYKIENSSPEIVKEMAKAAEVARVGPMAAVAGAIAEYVGRELLKFSSSVIVENGGDIFLKIKEKKKIGIFAGKSPLSLKIALEIQPEETPLGVCTSSGTVGPSLSFGNADAAVVIACSAAIADAVATACGNIVKKEEDIEKAIEFAKNIEGVKGVIIVINEKIGIWGDIKLVKI